MIRLFSFHGLYNTNREIHTIAMKLTRDDFYDQQTITITFAFEFFVTSYRLNDGANFDINSVLL